jgi:UrcA family protein
MIKTFACALALSALTFSVATAAVAAEPVQSETVRFGDLNLASPGGAETLRQRLNLAAQRVCDEKLDLKTDVFARRRARTCQALAVARAQAIVSASRGEAFLSAAR